MQNTKFIELLKSFSPAETGLFTIWVEKEIARGRKGNVRLLHAILKFAPTYQHVDLDKEIIWSQLYSPEPYADTRLKLETKALFDLAKAFLAFKELEQRPQELSLLSLAAIRQRGSERLLRTESDALRRQCAPQAAEDDQLRFTRFRLAEIANQHFGYSQKRMVDNNLQEMLDQLDRWYLVQKLRGACELLNRQNIFGTSANFSLITSLLEGIRQENFVDTPAIAAYQLVWEMLNDSSKRDAFEALVSLLAQQVHAFPQEEARALYKYAQNHCIAGINRGEQPYMKDLLALYQHQLETAILLRENVISYTDYTNITAAAVRLGERSWAREFIESYKSHLALAFQDSSYRYALALYHYHGKSYREAIRELSQIDFAESFYDLSARILLAKVYFESEEYEALTYHIEAFKRYLQRQKHLSAQNRNPYLNFLRLLKKLNRLIERWAILSADERRKRLQTMQKQLDLSSDLAHREWLQAQLEGLAEGE